jgi:hypothetical protein
MPINFRTLKQDVMQGYRPESYAFSTVPTTGGTTTTLVDGGRQEAAGAWDRVTSYIKFDTGQPGVASVNDGLVRIVTGYSTNGSVTWAPALTASVPSGSGYRLFQAFHPDNVVGLAINTTLRDNFPERVVSSIATINEQDEVRTYAVPSAVSNAITKLVKIERSVGTTSSSYQYRELRDHFDYEIVDYADTTNLQIQYIPVASTVLRLTGVRVASGLSADTDTTDEPPNLILFGSRALLAAQEGDQERIAYWTRKFEDAKRDYAKSRKPTPLRTPHFWVR